MYKRLRNLMFLAIIPVAIAGFVRIGSMGPLPGMAGRSSNVLEVSTVERGDVLLTVSATGPLQPRQSVSLAFPVTAKVAAINVTEGDYVRKGQVIATLSNQSYVDAFRQAQVRVVSQGLALRRLTDKPRPVDLLVYQVNLELAKARLSAAAGGPDRLQVQIDQLQVEKSKNTRWQAQLDRDAQNKQKEDLAKDPRTAPQAANLPSENSQNANLTGKDYDVKIAESQLADSKSKSGNVGGMASAEAQVVAAQVALDKLINPDKQDVARAEAQLQASQAALKLAEENLAKTVLVAPFDGVVAKLNLNLGEMPPTTGAAAIVLDTSSFYVDVPVDEADVSKVSVGQATTLALDALTGVPINGKVASIAQTATKSGDVVTYAVRIDIDPAGQPLRSSMSATASIITGQVNDVVRVRNRFVRIDRFANKSYTNVRQSDGTYKEVEITLGIRNDIYSEVKNGLSAGDVVAIIPITTIPTPVPGQGGGQQSQQAQ
jgi:RND family efflux transporter MFP subunit